MGSTLVRARGLAKAFGKGHARVPVLAGADLEVAPICALAGPSEILVSQTIRDLVARSGLRFEDKGTHPLKGVPGNGGCSS